jgi:hypothetical protein
LSRTINIYKEMWKLVGVAPWRVTTPRILFNGPCGDKELVSDI